MRLRDFACLEWWASPMEGSEPIMVAHGAGIFPASSVLSLMLFRTASASRGGTACSSTHTPIGQRTPATPPERSHTCTHIDDLCEIW
jgi:hypothetical protein